MSIQLCVIKLGQEWNVVQLVFSTLWPGNALNFFFVSWSGITPISLLQHKFSAKIVWARKFKWGFLCHQKIINFPVFQINSAYRCWNIFSLTHVSFIPYFRLLVFGIIVTLVAWFSFPYFPSCPYCLVICKQRLCYIRCQKWPKNEKWDEWNISK